MPFINVKLYAGQTKEKKETIAARITQVIREEMPTCPEQNIWVTFSDIPGDEWMIAGKLGPKA